MTTFCLSEDREAEEVGVRLAIASIRRQCPAARVVLYRPRASAELMQWAERLGQIEIECTVSADVNSWNCKPQALLPLLRRGLREVIWIDSDVLLSRDCLPAFDSCDDATLAICEEYASAPQQGSDLRTRGWGLPVGRSFARTLNTAVLRVTPQHISLLERWRELLSDPRYAVWQDGELGVRPVHCWSDQDVLNALLGSETFARVPVRLLRTGRDIVHCCSATSYSLRERLTGILHLIPPFVHAQGAKPWVVLDRERMTRMPDYARPTLKWIHEASLYRSVARTYRDDIDLPAEWMDYHSEVGRALGFLGCGHFAMRGLPLTTIATLARGMKRSSTG